MQIRIFKEICREFSPKKNILNQGRTLEMLLSLWLENVIVCPSLHLFRT